MLTREQFLKHLRSALSHLYDPSRLRQSPLAALLGVANRFDAPAALQGILTSAIQSLEPRDDEPPQTHAWWIYGPLHYRYVQQLSRQQVADQLGVSTRQLSRRTCTALEALTDLLWEQFDLEARLRQSTGEESRPEPAPAVELTMNEELAWMRKVPPEAPVDVNQTLLAVLAQAQPLAVQYGVRLEIGPVDELPRLAVHQLALKQVLLSLLSVAIHQSSGGEVHVLPETLHHEVEIQVRGRAAQPIARSTSDDDRATLEVAHQLAEICHGTLDFYAEAGTCRARLTIPALKQLVVLAIDDNADALQLFRRYTSNTRYRLVGTQDPQQALSLAQKLSPQIIVLDVMMPQVDGWELLALLRQHPHTSHIPIVACTILAQEEMALSLGASGFVHKPITRQAFLAALDRQIELPASGSR